MVNRFGINHVVVVKDEDERVFYGSNVIEQGRQNRYGWRWLRRLERTQHAFSNSRRNRLQSSDEVRQKACGVVLPFVQRQPGGTGPRSLDSLDPFTDQRGFPKASGGSDEGQFAVQTRVEPLDQAGAADNFRPKPREIQFRGENGRRHVGFFSLHIEETSLDSTSRRRRTKSLAWQSEAEADHTTARTRRLSCVTSFHMP